jgi:hypothetical protein
MPKQDYAFEPGGEKRLSVAWNVPWRNLSILFDGQVVGSFEGEKELKEGGAFKLPDGSTLDVKLVAATAQPELQVSRNGAPLPLFGVPAAAPAGGPVAPAVRTLTGDAEKRRLQMTERLGTVPAAAARGVAGGKPTMENVAQALRFTAHKCEITDAGLKVTFGPGRTREVAWADIGRLVVRQLPPDQPWNAAVLLDIVALLDGTKWEPIRVFATTFVNYGVLPGGASTSRLENIRNFTKHLRDRNPAAQLDPETTTFVEGTAVPSRFANMTQFAEYDSHYH